MNTVSIERGRRAVRSAQATSDYIVLAVTFVSFFFFSSGYFIVSYFVDVSYDQGITVPMAIFGLLGMVIGALVFFGAALLIGMLLIKMQRQIMLGNSLQVEYSDYAWLRDWANETAQSLEMPRVEIFVTQDPYINAYAFGFIKPYTIVLHSGSIRYLSKEELKVVVVHEMGHIKYGHTIASLYLLPFLSIPVLGSVFTWICRILAASSRINMRSPCVDVYGGCRAGEAVDDKGSCWA